MCLSLGGLLVLIGTAEYGLAAEGLRIVHGQKMGVHGFASFRQASSSESISASVKPLARASRLRSAIASGKRMMASSDTAYYAYLWKNCSCPS